MLAALWAVDGFGALAAEAVLDPPAAQTDPFVRNPLIQNFTPKRYLKTKHIEVMPGAGLMLGDPFVRRWLVGGTVAWHMSEVAALSTTWQFSPNLGELDWTPTTDDMVSSKLAVPELAWCLPALRSSGRLVLPWVLDPWSSARLCTG